MNKDTKTTKAIYEELIGKVEAIEAPKPRITPTLSASYLSMQIKAYENYINNAKMQMQFNIRMLEARLKEMREELKELEKWEDNE